MPTPIQTTNRPVHGIAAPLGYNSTEGMRRRISTRALTVRATSGEEPRPLAPGDTAWPLQLPLMAIWGISSGHSGAEPVGVLTTASVDAEDWTLTVEGTVFDDRVPAGTWACGVDLSQVTAELVDATSGQPFTDSDIRSSIDRGVDLDVVQVTTAGQLLAVTLYLPDAAGQRNRGAFQVAALTVEAA